MTATVSRWTDCIYLHGQQPSSITAASITAGSRPASPAIWNELSRLWLGLDWTRIVSVCEAHRPRLRIKPIITVCLLDAPYQSQGRPGERRQSDDEQVERPQHQTLDVVAGLVVHSSRALLEVEVVVRDEDVAAERDAAPLPRAVVYDPPVIMTDGSCLRRAIHDERVDVAEYLLWQLPQPAQADDDVSCCLGHSVYILVMSR